ncbi:hypothetical protein [Sporosarcina sp. BP05]|uniref:hypothetical protein n=1 Tax=Sporosarcina sp. BP05 TaxID=2758726 RepID=UPI001647C219|nr:hypothetical protein [Sporosarcina sp. BP05]
MKCMICETPYGPSDILVMEDDELPVCDECELKRHYVLVEYDGKEDLLDHLKVQVYKTRLCLNCDRGRLELHSIKFGNPIAAVVCCDDCKKEDKMIIYLRMI